MLNTILSYVSVAVDFVTSHSVGSAFVAGGIVTVVSAKIKGFFTSAETKLANLKAQVAKLEADIAGKL